jgi:hypothetical protein
MKIKASDILEQVAYENGWSFRDDYSGRGMMSKECLAIVSNGRSPLTIAEKAAMRGITGSTWDSMGQGVVVYWPKLTIDSEVDDVELVVRD